MSNAELVVVGSSTHAELVPVASLTVRTFRSAGLCAEQVDRLVDLHGDWPPVLVRRSDCLVVDGAHRVAAARRLGLPCIEVVFFEGDLDDAFVEFVRRNVSQGLALTLDERRRAAARVLASHPTWSDRRIAQLCALSPKTVAGLRRSAGGGGAKPVDGLREGRDRRLRPVERGSARTRALEVLRARPNASLREVAVEARVSPETVRQAKLRIVGAEAVSDGPVSPVRVVAIDGASAPRQPRRPVWEGDAAIAASDPGGEFATWFRRTAIGDEDLAWVESVPLSRVYVIAEEARRRAETWLALARVLEARPAAARGARKK